MTGSRSVCCTLSFPNGTTHEAGEGLATQSEGLYPVAEIWIGSIVSAVGRYQPLAGPDPSDGRSCISKPSKPAFCGVFRSIAFSVSHNCRHWFTTGFVLQPFPYNTFDCYD